MNVVFHKDFVKQLKKLSPEERNIVKERLELFLLDPFHPKLRNHPLKGKYLDYRSIDIRPDLRALYKHVSDDEAIFVLLGNHSQFYK